MIFHFLRSFVLVVALAPLAYYLIATYCGWSYFHLSRKLLQRGAKCKPPVAVSILKPVCGVDRGAYENFASFCRLDYPEYEILFGVTDENDPVIPVVEELQRSFPGSAIRLFVGAPLLGTSPKMNLLSRLVREAKHNFLVINDSDVRVERDYLLDATAPFQDPKVGLVTALFRGITEGDFASDLDAVGGPSDSSASALVAEKFSGMDFALGWTMATTKQRLEEIGGFESMADHHSDDFTLGNKIARNGYRIALMRKPIWMVFPREGLSQFLRHELRWSIMLRSIRPVGYLGLAMTFGLPWAVLAAVASPSFAWAVAYILAYLVLRLTMAWTIGVWGLADPVVRRKIWLVPIRDAVNFFVWIGGFLFSRVQWRGKEYRVKGSCLIPLTGQGIASADLSGATSATLVSARR
ncbi:MAG TPA: bacteriohopanetetrol glucosamine biosynthesis glycosyltransferase HpnI [Candidatus Acidoferrum sp.]|nr:bacteriohopanetetrol glucosamine biosynthesis glycosyltransferase HpnI [Candidatus Acidoferrum sp.]